jgi:hypothetical protein
MAELILKGTVLPDGKIEVQGPSALRPGEEVEIRAARLPKMHSVSLQEAQRLLAEPEREMTEEEAAWYHQAFAMLAQATFDGSDLPEDYIDELDHYLYGTPKRSENREA